MYGSENLWSFQKKKFSIFSRFYLRFFKIEEIDLNSLFS